MAAIGKLPAGRYRKIAFVDINILPAEYRRPPLQLATLVLFLFIVIGLASLYGTQRLVAEVVPVLQSRESELRGLQSTKRKLDATVEEANKLQQAIDKNKETLQTMQRDYKLFADGKISWSKVVSTILVNSSNKITFESMGQADSSISIKGIAVDYADIISYGDSLLKSGLFTRVHIESAVGQVPPTPVPAATVATTPTPIATPAPTSTPVAIIIPTATPLRPTPTVTLAPTATPVPTATAAPTSTPTPIPSPTPTPSVDYIVLSKKRTSVPGTTDLYNVIKGKVVDKEGRLVPGLKFRARSCCPEWQAEYPRPGDRPSDGTFEFLVGKWRFDLSIVGARAEVANDLNTNEPDFTGYHIWEVTFQKIYSSSTAQAEVPLIPQSLGSLAGARLISDVKASQEVQPEAIKRSPAPSPAPPADQKTAVSFTMILEVKPGSTK